MTAADKALRKGSRHSTIAIRPTIGLGAAAATAGVINHGAQTMYKALEF